MQTNEPIFSDDDVVRSVQEGKTQNFEILVNRYKNKMVNFIHKMIFDYDEAQSLAQDVFVKVYETIGRYRSQDNFQSFIFTIGKNLTLNFIKKQKRMLWFSNSPGNSGKEHFTSERHFQTKAEQHELLEKDRQQLLVSEGLKALNENQRIALIMKVYLEFSYNKIADITGWSIPKIETLISRGKSNLKAFVLEEHGRLPNKNMQEKQKLGVLEVRSI